MAPIDRDVGHSSALTPEECNFIMEVLGNVNLRDSPAALRQALELIDGITGKLADELEEAEKTKNPHFPP